MNIRPITSITDPRLLGVVDVVRASFPNPAPGFEAQGFAQGFHDLTARRNTCPDSEVSEVDAAFIDLALSMPLPDYAQWLRMDRGGDYHGRSFQAVLWGVMRAADLTAAQAGELIGVKDRAIRRWLEPVGTAGHRQMPYAAWFTLLTKLRVQGRLGTLKRS
ncbi:hypothetical protein [Sinimarinibacterium sp. NLF-5-8]|uniref:hypothetical protein n=1 Tax=Sinimarinibacterium sp. NLF-5-8 TaxID=2698684 RepID=UPI00137C162A|nr:hypothetical protein [Sinimarinibacterium sp. NLF-5-8]QHS09156.1 hypothetical protein GT972_02620 [Sinimarinibacterium sp. NLF-5-8]